MVFWNSKLYIQVLLQKKKKILNEWSLYVCFDKRQFIIAYLQEWVYKGFENKPLNDDKYFFYIIITPLKPFVDCIKPKTTTSNIILW
jgi:hypothetical protein